MILANTLMKYLCILLFISLIHFSCNPKVHNTIINGDTMGTSYSITISKFRHDQDKFKDQIDSVLNIINSHFSTYIDYSEISKINNQNSNSISLSDEFLYVLRSALYYCKLSGGNYDITVEPLVDLWGFGKSKDVKFPNKRDIEVILKNVGYENIILKNDILINKNKVRLDLNSIAKGYGVDRVFEYILERGYSNYLVEIGGEIRSSNDMKEDWIIGILNPKVNSIIKKVRLNNKSMATSGTYNNFFEHSNKIYSHILNPKTGYPYMYNSVSATIIADKCIDADAYATLAMTMDPNKVVELINKKDGVDCYIIEIGKDDNIIEYKSNHFDSFILF